MWHLFNTIFRQGRSESDHSSKDTIRIGKPGNFEWWVVNSMRMSGSPDTSFGNTIVNECVVYALLHMQGISDYKVFLEGDDALIETQTPLDVDKMYEDSVKAGFKLKLEIREKPWNAGFLSTVWDPETLIPESMNMRLDLYSVFSHYGAQFKKLGEQSYLKSKMLSLLLRNPSNKLYYHLWNKTQQLTKGEVAKFQNNYWNSEIILKELNITAQRKHDILEVKDINVEDKVFPEYFENKIYDLDVGSLVELINSAQNLDDLYEVARYLAYLSKNEKLGLDYNLTLRDPKTRMKSEHVYEDSSIYSLRY